MPMLPVEPKTAERRHFRRIPSKLASRQRVVNTNAIVGRVRTPPNKTRTRLIEKKQPPVSLVSVPGAAA
jgi:hypothetical protein